MQEKSTPPRPARGHANLPAHPLAPPSGSILRSRVILYDAIGPGPHPCHWCGEPLNWTVGTQVHGPGVLLSDHVDGDPIHDVLENLVPSCAACNGNRTRTGKIRPDEITVLRGPYLVRGATRTCPECGEEYTTSLTQIRYNNHFCSKSCSQRHHMRERQREQPTERNALGQFMPKVPAGPPPASTRVLLTCHECGVNFFVSPSTAQRSKWHFCSSACARKNPPWVIQPDETFVVHADGTRHRAAMLVCVQCGTSFLRSLHYIHRNPNGKHFCSRDCPQSRKRFA